MAASREEGRVDARIENERQAVVDIGADTFACVAGVTGGRGGTMADMKWGLEETKTRRPAPRDCQLPARSHPLPPVLLCSVAGLLVDAPARPCLRRARAGPGAGTASEKGHADAAEVRRVLSGSCMASCGACSTSPHGMQPCEFHVGGKARPADKTAGARDKPIAAHIHTGTDGQEEGACTSCAWATQPPTAPHPQAGACTEDGKTAPPAHGGETTDSVPVVDGHGTLASRRVVPCLPQSLNTWALACACGRDRRYSINEILGSSLPLCSFRHRSVTSGCREERDSRLTVAKSTSEHQQTSISVAVVWSDAQEHNARIRPSCAPHQRHRGTNVAIVRNEPQRIGTVMHTPSASVALHLPLRERAARRNLGLARRHAGNTKWTTRTQLSANTATSPPSACMHRLVS